MLNLSIENLCFVPFLFASCFVLSFNLNNHLCLLLPLSAASAAPFLLCFLFPLRQLLESEKALHGSDLRSPCLGSVTIVSVLKEPLFFFVVSDYFCH